MIPVQIDYIVARFNPDGEPNLHYAIYAHVINGGAPVVIGCPSDMSFVPVDSWEDCLNGDGYTLTV